MPEWRERERGGTLELEQQRQRVAGCGHGDPTLATCVQQQSPTLGDSICQILPAAAVSAKGLQITEWVNLQAGIVGDMAHSA